MAAGRRRAPRDQRADARRRWSGQERQVRLAREDQPQRFSDGIARKEAPARQQGLF
jgi:hypothetical protein